MGDDVVVNKKVRVIFQDLNNSRSKIGYILSQDSSFLTIKTDNKVELIPICKIIRIEVLNGN